MTDNHLDPARTVITKIGVAKVAMVTGKHVSCVYRWMYPRERGGTGGFIPQADAQAILRYARQHDIALTPAEFLEVAAD